VNERALVFAALATSSLLLLTTALFEMLLLAPPARRFFRFTSLFDLLFADVEASSDSFLCSFLHVTAKAPRFTRST